MVDVPRNEFSAYIVEANFGQNGRKVTGPARLIYEHVRGAVEAGAARFATVSGREDLMDDITNVGIICFDKFREIGELVRYLKG